MFTNGSDSDDGLDAWSNLKTDTSIDDSNFSLHFIFSLEISNI